MKLDLLTNATVIDDAIRFVSNKPDGKLKRSSSSNTNEGDDKEESKEPDYDDEDGDQLEEVQEEQTEEVTTKQVF